MADKEKTQQVHKNLKKKNNDGIRTQDKIQANLNTVTTKTNTNTNDIEECEEYEHTVLNSDEKKEIKAAIQENQVNKDVNNGKRKADKKNTVYPHIKELHCKIGDTQ